MSEDGASMAQVLRCPCLSNPAPGYSGKVIDWHKAFGVQTPPVEIVLRGSIVYLALYFLLRVVPNGRAAPRA